MDEGFCCFFSSLTVGLVDWAICFCACGVVVATAALAVFFQLVGIGSDTGDVGMKLMKPIPTKKKGCKCVIYGNKQQEKP